MTDTKTKRKPTWPNKAARKRAYALMGETYARSQGQGFEVLPTLAQDAIAAQAERERQLGEYTGCYMDKLNAMCQIVALVEGIPMEKVREKVCGY